MGAGAVHPDAAVDATARRDGFTLLYDRHVREVYRYVHRRCRDRTIAEDVTQDAFVAAVRSFDDAADVTIAWLVGVARNRLIDVLRREQRGVARLPLLAARADVELDPGLLDRVRLQRAFDALSLSHRLVLSLHYLDERTVPEIADAMGRSSKGVEALLTRARRALAHELEVRGG